MSGGYAAPPEGDGRTRRDRSLAQRLAAARANVSIERDELARVARAAVAAERAGNLTMARRLAATIPFRREAIRLRQEQLAEVEEEVRRAQA